MRARSILAAFAASALLLTCSDIITADLSPAVYAEEIPESTALPDWVPDDQNDALRFFNLHGCTYIQDGLLCVTFCRSHVYYDELSYSADFTGEAMEEVAHNLYELPEENRSGNYNDIEVFVFRPVRAGSFTAKLTGTSANGFEFESPTGHTYEFTVDEALGITETDICAVLPDCRTELEEYYSENGAVSTIGNKMIFCISGTERLFSEWKEGFVSDNVQLKERIDCSSRAMREFVGSSFYPSSSRTSDDIYVYEAVSDGPVEVRWDVVDIYHTDSTSFYSISASYEDAALTKPSLSAGDARIRVSDYETGQPVLLGDDSGFAIHRRAPATDSSTLIAPVTDDPCVIPGLYSSNTGATVLSADMLSFRLVPGKGYSIPKKGNTTANADDHLSITIVNGNALDLEYRVLADLSGDANGDGEFGAADIVTLGKWLLGRPDAELANWKACDLCNDNVIDSFDLCLMRNALVESMKPEVITLMMVDERRSHMTAAGLEYYDRIITYDTENLAGMDEILSLVSRISDKAESYTGMKPEMIPCSVADYGEDTLYIYYRRPDKDPERLALCSYGQTCACLPDADVRELVCLMNDNGLFADAGFSDVIRGQQ